MPQTGKLFAHQASQSSPHFYKMAADYQEGRFDTVLVTKHSRLSRANSGDGPGWPFPVISAAPLEAE